MGEFFKALPEIIKYASQSPLGIIALLVVVLGALAYTFFHQDSLRVRIAIWLCIAVGAVGFFVTGYLGGVNASHATAAPTVNTAATTTKSENHDTIAVSGTTVDSNSNDAIRGVQITFVGRAESAVSDDNGNFTVELTGNGDDHLRLRLRATKDGYAPYDVGIIAPATSSIVPLRKAHSK